MAAFEYVVLDARGREKKGIVEGDTPRQVRQQLRDKGLVPLSVETLAEKQRKKLSSSGGFQLFKPRLSATDLALVTRQMATLVKAALPIEEALKAVADQSEKPKLKSLMLSVRSRVVEGHTLADALSEFPTVFDELFRSMVAAGEKSGFLDETLERLADYTEKRQAMKQQISGAMVYPIILAVISVGIIGFLLSYVVPEVVKNFTTSGAELPGLTQALLSVSDFVQNWGLFLVLGFVALTIGWQQLKKNPKIHLAYDRFLIRSPGIGKVIRGLNSARFARTLAIMNASAVPLLDGLRIASDVMTNLEIKGAVRQAAVKVREGAGLKVSLQECGYFPPIMLHMIAAGENSGELEQMLERAADNQERQFETLVTVSLNVLGPIMILIMGAFVLTIVLAIMMPIFELNSLLTS